jgi:hypothetical protein
MFVNLWQENIKVRDHTEGMALYLLAYLAMKMFGEVKKKKKKKNLSFRNLVVKSDSHSFKIVQDVSQ